MTISFDANVVLYVKCVPLTSIWCILRLQMNMACQWIWNLELGMQEVCIY